MLRKSLPFICSPEGNARRKRSLLHHTRRASLRVGYGGEGFTPGQRDAGQLLQRHSQATVLVQTRLGCASRDVPRLPNRPRRQLTSRAAVFFLPLSQKQGFLSPPVTLPEGLMRFEGSFSLQQPAPLRRSASPSLTPHFASRTSHGQKSPKTPLEEAGGAAAVAPAGVPWPSRSRGRGCSIPPAPPHPLPYRSPPPPHPRPLRFLCASPTLTETHSPATARKPRPGKLPEAESSRAGPPPA